MLWGFINYEYFQVFKDFYYFYKGIVYQGIGFSF